MYNAATKHFYPLILIKDLKLKAGFGEGEVCINPPHLGVCAKQIFNYFFDGLLHIVNNIFDFDLAFFSQHIDSLHLMEYWIMELIDLISAINVTLY